MFVSEEEEESEEKEEAAVEEDKTELFVGNLAFATSEQTIRQAFSKFGQITNIKMPTDPQGRPKGFAFINFANSKDANKACAGLNG